MKKTIASLIIFSIVLLCTGCSPASTQKALSIIDGILNAGDSLLNIAADQNLVPAPQAALIGEGVSLISSILMTVNTNIGKGIPPTQQVVTDVNAAVNSINSVPGLPPSVRTYTNLINAGVATLTPILTALISQLEVGPSNMPVGIMDGPYVHQKQHVIWTVNPNSAYGVAFTPASSIRDVSAAGLLFDVNPSTKDKKMVKIHFMSHPILSYQLHNMKVKAEKMKAKADKLAAKK